jgi:HD-GYP domain-containing protein (c-di-GMP phosphodiesterase class II)
MLIHRLGFGPDVGSAFGFTLRAVERGRFPNGAKGEEIPLPMRIVHVSHDMEAIGRRSHRPRRRRRSPIVADAPTTPTRRPVRRARGRLVRADREARAVGRRRWTSSRNRTASLEAPSSTTRSPWRPTSSTSSRRTGRAQPSLRRARADAAPVLGLPKDEVTTIRRAALVHEFGTTGVPNSIWDKPGSLTRAEFDRVELHPMLTEQMLRRSSAFASLNPFAASHHERWTARVSQGPADR